MTDIKARLDANETLYGTFLGLGSALATEACAIAGFDWLLVDLEHGGGDERALLHQLLAAAAHGVPTLTRVESADRIRAGRVLDLGTAGVMFPRLEDKAAVEDAMRHLRYPPEGDRGVAASNRARGFGLYPNSVETANGSIIAAVQIESRRALEVIDDIAAVPGIDILFVGPRDLTHDLGVPGQTASPIFRKALDTTLAAAERSGHAAGILASDAAEACDYAAMGFRFIGIASEGVLLAHAARQAVQTVKQLQ